LPSRRVTATLVRSYRTISPLPASRSRGTAGVGGLFLWHFPAGFPGSSSTTLPCDVPTFLEDLELGLRGCLIRAFNLARPAPSWRCDLQTALHPTPV